MSSKQRQEIDALIRKVADLVEKKPSVAAKLLTAWVERKPPVSKSTQAPPQKIRKAG